MRSTGPLLTLLAVIGVAVGVLGMSMTRGPGAAPAPTGESATTAPPPAGFPTRAGYAGLTRGRATGEAKVQLAVRDGAALAYVWDGKKLASWLRGDVEGRTVSLRGSGADVMTGELAPGGTVTGDITLSGKHWQFAARPALATTAVRKLAAAGTATSGTTAAPSAGTPPARNTAARDAAEGGSPARSENTAQTVSPGGPAYPASAGADGW